MGHGAQHVDVRLTVLELDAALIRTVDAGEHGGGGEQGLRRDGVGQRARATEPAILDQRDLSAERCGGRCGRIASWTTTENHVTHDRSVP